MRANASLKLISSLPIILLALYFIPFVGISLIILRYFIYNNRYFEVPKALLGIGILVFIPQISLNVIKLLKLEEVIMLNDIVNSEVYASFIEYGKFLLCLGVVLIIVSVILRKVIERISFFVREYIKNEEKIVAEVARKNDMEIKIKQQKAKNTNVVFCPNCGADNILSEKVGVCKYCRSAISQENIKN